ncbi:MAG: ribose-phosphate diphosphokinase [Bacteroidia bacterium]
MHRSSFADKIITIDPHLHRRNSMEEIYSVPCEVLHTAPLIARWIKDNVSNGLLIGPDSESKQWVSEIARAADVPYLILEKTRSGDRDVEISIPRLEHYKSRIPILVDDIISTGQTMIETVHHLKKANMQSCICIGIHAVFASDAFERLKKSGAGSIITCNTIQHHSNRIDVSELLVNICFNKV